MYIYMYFLYMQCTMICPLIKSSTISLIKDLIKLGYHQSILTASGVWNTGETSIHEVLNVIIIIPPFRSLILQGLTF